MGVSATQRVEMELSTGVWTHIADVIASAGLRWRRGIDGRGPTDCVAGAGSFVFTLDNSAGNSEETQGCYSPHHASVLSGFGIGTAVRVVYAYGGTDYIRWRGKLAAIDPEPGRYRSQRVRCQAVGTIGDLLEEQVRAIAPQLNQTEVQLLTAILAALPTTAQPPATDFDTAIDSFPFAFDDLASGTIALTIIRDVVQSARGFYFEKGDGTHAYVNQQSHALAVSRFAFTDAHMIGLKRPTNFETVFNRGRVRTHAKKVGDTDTEVLFSHQGPLAIQPGETVEFFIEYQDPNTPGFPMGGDDFQAPLSPATDYAFNDDEEGGGADVTSDITITASFFASSCLLEIENTGAVVAYKQTLQGRGRSIRDLAPVWSESFQAMPYGSRTKEVDLRYQDDAAVGRDYAAYLQTQYRDLAKQIDAIEFIANDSDELMREALGAEIGDVVTVSETVTGTSLIDGYIQWIEFTVTPGPWIVCRFGLAPRIERQQSSAEDLTVADDLDVSSEAPETRIDEALIDFSEIA